MTETLSENQRTTTYYELLKLHPSASPQQIRQAFRDLSKLYHPDTTSLSPAIATAQFQQLNEAYATLSNPDRRFAYDRKIGYSRFTVIQPPADLNNPVAASRQYRSSAYLDPTDRPLSAGELFALFTLVLTFAGCLLIAVATAYARGGSAFQMIDPPLGQVRLLSTILPALQGLL